MVKLYTDLKYFDDVSLGVISVDADFDLSVYSTELFSDKVLEILKKYEESDIISDRLLNGRFGPYDIEDISTGVKTLIYLILVDEGKIDKPAFINVFECGPNVLSEVLYYIDKLSIPGFIKNMSIFELDDFSGIVNDSYKFNTVMDLIDYLEVAD